MEDTNALECFMALLDETKRVIGKDYLAEESDILEYQVKAKEAPAQKPVAQPQGTSPEPSGSQIASCHLCTACRNRSIYAEPIHNQNPKILFIASSPEGQTILDPASYDYFVKWINSIGLRRKDIALTTLIKCPVPSFDRSAADACRAYVREEMATLKPGAIVLLGSDAAFYMLRRSGDFNAVRGKRFTVNGIPVFCTYTPHQLFLDRGLRAPVWEDLKYIASSLGLGVGK